VAVRAQLDGIPPPRVQEREDVRLFSRNRLPQEQHYPSVVDAVRNLAVREVILDARPRGTRSPVFGYHVFDVMWLDGRDLTGLPLVERRALPPRPAASCPAGTRR